MKQSSKPGAVRLERVIPARPSEVYRAWLDPETLCRWLAPGGIRTDRVEIDERVGGHYRIWQSAGGTNAGGFDCEILELAPNKRIVFRWGFVGRARTKGPVYDSRLTITLRSGPGGTTRLTLLHERLEDLAAAMPHVADQVAFGWESVLEKLAAIVADAQEGTRCAR
jgi:uncharacterized protein YndB with AHSA1/START domain